MHGNRRIFTRRRHAVASSIWQIRLLAIIGIPALTVACVLYFVKGGVPVETTHALVSIGLTTALLLAYASAVLRVHHLTGEWTFF